MDSIENEASNNYSMDACIPCRGNLFTEPLTINDRRDTLRRVFAWKRQDGYTYSHTDSSFIKIVSDIQNLIERDSQTHRQHGDPRSLTYFLSYLLTELSSS
jgi:hypothetical protein